MMKYSLVLIPIVLILITSMFCFCQNRQQIESVPQSKTFSLPKIPMIITSQQEKEEYIAMHYWSEFDFKDTSLINNEEITEQIFANYINMIIKLPSAKSVNSLNKFLKETGKATPKMVNYIYSLADKYLYDPNSPYRNEECYIPFLEHIVNTKSIDSISTLKYTKRLNMALKNRPGEIAGDFIYTLQSGRKQSLYNTNAEYIMIFFNNPGCNDCSRIKNYITNSAIFNKRDDIKILSVYPDEDIEIWKNSIYPKDWINSRCYDVTKNELYDLKAIPTLYLLDSEKRVLLKDATIENIEYYIDYVL